MCVFAGSHKRSHSLGEKEICSTPAPEQQFRDRSNTLSEKPALPVIRDKYKDLTGEVEVRAALLSVPLFGLLQQSDIQSDSFWIAELNYVLVITLIRFHFLFLCLITAVFSCDNKGE